MNDSAKMRIEDSRRLIDRYHDIYSNGVKGLVFLNSAGVVAMLGFMQALVGKSTFVSFKPFGLVAVICFLIGATAGSTVFIARLHQVSGEMRGLSSRWEHVALWGVAFTLASFVTGACAIVAGLQRAQ